MRMAILNFLLFIGLIYTVADVESIGAPDFTSPWVDIAAYTTPEVTINHNLNGIPILVDIQVKVTDQAVGDIIFSGIGSAQKGNDDNLPFGGVLYLYNENVIKIIAPGPISCAGSCMGSVVFLGGNGYSGPTTVSGSYSSAKVRARVWSMCNFLKPDYISPLTTMSSASKQYEVFNHGIKKVPDLVIVQAKFSDGYVMDGHGSAFYTSTTTTFGGVIFGFNKDDVRVWIPRRGSGSGNGAVFSAVNGWGNNGTYGYFESGSIRVWAWTFNGLNHNPKVYQMTTWKGYGSAEDVKIVTLNPLFDIDNYILKVQVSPDTNGNNTGYIFYGAGSTMTEGTVVAPNAYYGSLIYGVSSTGSKLYMWRPADVSTGCITVVSGMWGNDTSSQCAPLAIVKVRMFKTSTSASESVCGSLACSLSSNGPTCNCTGIGKIGQFCNEDVTCHRPTDHVAAYITNKKTVYIYNETAMFSCDVGHKYLSGSSSRLCQEDTTWNGTPYICEPVPCDNPTPGVNSVTNTSGRTNHVYLDETYYTCNAGYSLKTGNLTTICSADGNWSGNPPVCDKSCGDPTALTAVRTNWGNTVGVTALFECLDGYQYLSGDYNRTCESNGTWNNTPLDCTRKDCGAPDAGSNSAISLSDTLYGSVVTYTCNEGYHSSGSTSLNRSCQADQTWSNAPLDCTKISCGPVDGGNDTHLFKSEGDKYLDQVQFACNYGYKFTSGDLTRQCQSNASWSGEQAVCEEIICDMVDTNYTNGNVTVTGTSFGSFIIVVCDEGYAVKTGNAMRICGASGTWTGSPAVCKAVMPFVFLEDTHTFKNGCVIQTNNTQIVNQSYVLEDLRIDRKNTSKYKRTLSSVWEDRVSAIIIGSVGAVVLFAVFAFICFLDCVDLAQRPEK